MKLHQDALFKQLSSLGVGPLLVKQESGENISDHPSLLELCAQRFSEVFWPSLRLQSAMQRCIISPMQEVLSNTADPTAPLPQLPIAHADVAFVLWKLGIC